jgi:thiosulfate dehydrogenase [quinone] large subunit
MLGIMVRLASLGGMIMLVLMYLAGFIPPEHNPLIDDHIIYAIVLILFLFVPVGEWLGFGRKWARTNLVENISWLR